MSTIDPTKRRELESAVRDHRAGRLREAVAAYENLLRRAPDDPDLMQLLGVALGQLGKHLRGARLLPRSLELKPVRPSAAPGDRRRADFFRAGRARHREAASDPDHR